VSDPGEGAGAGRAADEASQAAGEPRPSVQRLDPDLAAPPPATSSAPSKPPTPAPPVIDTRPYRWMVGIIGLAIVLGVSVYQFASHGVGSTGVAAGHRLRFFAAPLAATNLQGDANARPTCSAARHDPRALNVCLMVRRGPLVLSFFVTGAGQCVRQVSALQTLAGRFPSVQFAAVAINGNADPGAPLDDPGGL
jgi:hypothetical protein